jgi:hypothetical protein
LNTVAKLISARDICFKLLPIGQSFIAYDILLLVIHSHISKQNLTLKNLFASIPYSVMGARHHLRRLVGDGWIELVVDNKDNRVKICRPTEKLCIRIDLLFEELKDIQ